MAKFQKKAAPAPASDDSGPSDSGMSETLGGASNAGSGKPAGYGSGSKARLAKNADAMSDFAIPLTVRNNEPGPLPDWTSKVASGGPEDKAPHPARKSVGLPDSDKTVPGESEV